MCPGDVVLGVAGASVEGVTAAMVFNFIEGSDFPLIIDFERMPPMIQPLERTATPLAAVTADLPSSAGSRSSPERSGTVGSVLRQDAHPPAVSK